jgi:hypothetical protein
VIPGGILVLTWASWALEWLAEGIKAAKRASAAAKITTPR